MTPEERIAICKKRQEDLTPEDYAKLAEAANNPQTDDEHYGRLMLDSLTAMGVDTGSEKTLADKQTPFGMASGRVCALLYMQLLKQGLTHEQIKAGLLKSPWTRNNTPI